MKPGRKLFAIWMLALTFITCSKQKNAQGCEQDSVTARKIVNQPAIIKLTATRFPVLIIEDGTIDTKLVPCNFPMEYYQDDLKVTISGDVKSSASGPSDPCCMEYFVITNITR